MHVKICGITSVHDARQAAYCGADFVGLILAPSSRRVTVDIARDVAAALPAATQPVVLFRDAPLEDVLSALELTGCAWVQLHGREPVTYLAELARHRVGVHLIRAWEITSPTAGDELVNYLREAAAAGVRIDAVILDAPKGGPHPGFERLGDISLGCRPRPPEVWCAGGLSPANLVMAVATGQYDGVDVARGVESQPGIKDYAALEQFVTTAKRL